MFGKEPMNSFPIAWNTRYVQRGTPWPDEPSECIDPGWYVIGHDAITPVDETDVMSSARIHVEHATDSDGNDITESLACQVVEAMTRGVNSTANPIEHPGETVQLTADVVAFHRDQDGVLRVLVVERGYEPYAGRHALPGGFVDPGEASVDAAVRELVEETSIGIRERIAAGKCTELVQVGAYDAPGRDPRGRVVSVVHTVVLLDQRPDPVAADDAAAAEWVRVDGLLADPDRLAFDHAEILTDAITVIRRVTPLGA